MEKEARILYGDGNGVRGGTVEKEKKKKAKGLDGMLEGQYEQKEEEMVYGRMGLDSDGICMERTAREATDQGTRGPSEGSAVEGLE